MKKNALRVMVLLIVAAALGGGFLYYQNWSKYQALEPGSESEDVELLYPGPWSDKIPEPPTEAPEEEPAEEEPSEAAAAPTGKRVHFLLLGLDGGQRLADVVMVVTIDTGSKSGRVISVPRDTLAYIPGKGRDGKCKITEIYWFGGSREVMLQNVRRLTGISPHYYVEVTFGGFENIVNALGGVNVGGQRLNGNQALKMARDRSAGDHDRIYKQQQIMMGLLREIRGVKKDLSAVTSLIWTGLKNVKTNMSFDDALNLYHAAEGVDPTNTYFYTIDTRWEQVDGVWYCIPN